MKFKIGDKVKVIATEDELEGIGIVTTAKPGDIGVIRSGPTENGYYEVGTDGCGWPLYFRPDHLELVKP